MSGRKRRFEKFSRSADRSDSSSEEENFNESKDNIGPSLPPHILCKRNEEMEAIGPAIPAHLRRKQPEDGSRLEEKVIGPILPPHLIKTKQEDSTIGPALPTNLTKRNEQTFGPILPSHLQKESHSNNSQERKEIAQVLPAYLKNAQSEDSTKKVEPIIGPIIPSHLKKNHPESSSNLDERKEEVIGPALPPNLKNNLSGDSLKKAEIIGPIMPFHFLGREDTEGSKNGSRSIGPVLPPNFVMNEPEAAGPALPPHLQAKTSQTEQREERVLGPSLPPGFLPPEESESEDESYGPDPRLQHSGDISMENVVDARAERARRKLLGLDDKKVVRESWMLELPPEKAAIVGLGARQFRAKLAPEMGDRSVWTDTPSEAAKKASEPAKQDDTALMQQAIIDQRDKEMEKMARKAAKKAKRDQSLMDLHAKQMKKQAKEEAKKMEGKPKERKMFSREEDMQVHRFDEAQKKAILKKAQMLDDRFSRGQSKFL